MRGRTPIAWLLALAAAGAGAEPVAEAQALLQAQRTRPDAARFEQARAILTQLTAQAPRDARAWTLLAWAHLTEHRFGEALAAAETAAALAPDRPEPQAVMTDALVELGRYPQALDCAQRLLDLDPGVPAWARAARLRFLHGDLDGALALLTQAAAVAGPRGEAAAWVQLELARLHLEAGDPVAAEADLTAAALAFPDHIGLPAARARVTAARGDPGGALDLYLAAIAAQPNAEDALAAWRLARTLGQAGATRHLAALLDGLALLDTGLSRRALAEYLAEAGQTDRALDLARTELALRPDLYSHATLARVLARAGSSGGPRAWAEAREQAHLALALGTPDTRLRADMGAILGEGQRAESVP